MVWYSRLSVKVFLLVICIASIVGVYAYSTIFNVPAIPKATVTSGPLEFSMSLDKTEFRDGENITMKFRLENIGNTTITISRGQPPIWREEYLETSYSGVHGDSWHLNHEFHSGFIISHVNGTAIATVTEGILAYGYEFHMDPGGWIEQTIIWDNQYLTSEWGWGLPLDNYQIRGAMEYRLNSGPRDFLETPSIAFSIE